MSRFDAGDAKAKSTIAPTLKSASQGNLIVYQEVGYPRSLVRPDGRVHTAYYFNGPKGSDRCIEDTVWTPPEK